MGAVGPAGPAGQSITGPAGPAGTPGTAGTNGTNGISAIATTTGTPPAIPAVGSSADYVVNSTTGLVNGQYYGFGSLTGTLLITAIPSATTVTLQNVDATAGATVAAGIKLGPVGKTVSVVTGGGASGIQYYYNTTPGSGVVTAADLTTATSLSINVADALGKSHSTLLGRLKVGAIIVIAKNSTNFVEYSVTSDYTSGSVGVAVNAFAGSFVSGTDTVYLSIVSDAPSTGGGGSTAFSAGTIEAVGGSGQIQVNQLTPPSNSSWPIYTNAYYIDTTNNFAPTSGNLVAGQTGSSATITGLGGGTTYYIRKVVSDVLGNKEATLQVSAVPVGARADTTALTNALVAAGYTPSTAETNAYDGFFIATDALRSAVTAEYGFLGSAYASGRINWANPGTYNCIEQTNSGSNYPTYGALGVTCTRFAYLLTGFVMLQSQINSFGFGAFHPSGFFPNNNNYLGFFGSTGGSSLYTGNSNNEGMRVNEASLVFNAAGAARHWVSASRTSSSNVNWTSGVNSGSYSATSVDTPSNYGSNANFAIGAAWDTAGLVANKNDDLNPIGFVVIFNRGMSSTELSTYRTAALNLMTALGR